MSLFRYHEFVSHTSPEATSIDVGFLLGKRDVIAIGSLTGTLSILDPGIDIENRDTKSLILEEVLEYPILQLCVGKFLSSLTQDLLACLHPKFLIFYRIFEVSENIFSIEKVMEHKLPSPGYNMCVGKFGKSIDDQVCVQSLNCSLSVFETEHFVFTRQFQSGLHPGPLCYSEEEDSLFVANGHTLTAIKFQILTSASSIVTDDKRNIAYDWSINLGDVAIEMVVAETSPVQPSVLVLCKKILYCFTVSGNLRYILRFDYVALSLKMYEFLSDAYIRFCIGTSTRNLLFYMDTKLTWSTQLDFTPISIRVATFTERYRSMVTVLSDEGKCSVIYLGTEPHLFKFSVSENRFINFEERKKELKEYEAKIKLLTEKDDNDIIIKSDDETIVSKEVFKVQFEDNLEGNKKDNKKTCYLHVSSNSVNVQILVKSQIGIIKSETLASHITDKHEINFDNDKSSITDTKVNFFGIFENGKCMVDIAYIPLNVICRIVTPQRNANFKLSFDSKYSALPLSKIFDEFDFDNQYQVAFQMLNSDVCVSIFIAKSSNRYRVQSNSTECLYLFISELNRRLFLHYDDPHLRCAIPLEMFTDDICRLVSKETEISEVRKKLEKHTLQFRHSQMLFLTKLKNDREEVESHIHLYLDYCYKQLQSELDLLIKLDNERKELANGLVPLLNLFSLLMKMNGVDLIFDGSILESSNQDFSLLFGTLLSTQKGLPVQEVYDSQMIRKLMDSLYNSEGFLTEIAEEEEDEIEEEKEDNPNIEEQFEFSNLQSGSMKVTQIE
uniref:Protein PTHB1 (inferred by orthology to a human protein) n=1 Tax=Strongyloides venezuelensis TaxID=75913 RepID=A0A0K0G2M1_STRVS